MLYILYIHIYKINIFLAFKEVLKDNVSGSLVHTKWRFKRARAGILTWVYFITLPFFPLGLSILLVVNLVIMELQT